LWHKENIREKIDRNDRLLDRAIHSDTYYCNTGIKINNE